MSEDLTLKKKKKIIHFNAEDGEKGLIYNLGYNIGSVKAGRGQRPSCSNSSYRLWKRKE